MNSDDCKVEVIDRIGQFVSVAKGSGINLCHENEKGIYGDSPERCLDIFEGLSKLERKGEESVVGNFSYPDSNTAFDVAFEAFKAIV